MLERLLEKVVVLSFDANPKHGSDALKAWRNCVHDCRALDYGI